MAATIVDLASTSKDALTAGVAEMFLQYSDPLRWMNYETIGDLRVAMSRIAVLPTVGYRAINGTYTESTGRFEQLEEDLSIIGGDIDIDLQLEGNKSQLVSQESVQTQAKMKAMAYRVNDDLINGDRAADPLEVDGLAVRVANLPARQTFDAGGAGTDLAVFASNATLNTFVDSMDDAISRIDNGEVSFILGDEVSIRGIFSAYRRLALGTEDVKPHMLAGKESNMNAVSLKIGSKGPIPLIVMGFTDETQGTRVMPSTETLGDGSADTASLYFVRQGRDYFTGLQKHPLKTEKFPHLEAAPQKRVRIEWPMGYSNWNDRSIVRLTGLRFAAT